MKTWMWIVLVVAAIAIGSYGLDKKPAERGITEPPIRPWPVPADTTSWDHQEIEEAYQENFTRR